MENQTAWVHRCLLVLVELIRDKTYRTKNAKGLTNTDEIEY